MYNGKYQSIWQQAVPTNYPQKKRWGIFQRRKKSDTMDHQQKNGKTEDAKGENQNSPVTE